MKEYKILFHPIAFKELKSLDGSVQKKVLKQVEKLKNYPQLGPLLGNKHGYDLAGYRKLYVDNKRVRIIYSIIDDQVVVKILAIGKREDFEVYKDATARL